METETPVIPAAPAAPEPSILDSAKAPAEPGTSESKASPDAKPAEIPAADGSQKPPVVTPKPGDEKPAETKPGAVAPLGAPEKYEPFKAPEGVTLDEKATSAFEAKAKELNLSQDQAQKLVDFQMSAVKAAQTEQEANFKTIQKTWAEDTRKALGADADKQLAHAASFRDKFLTPEARKILNETGLANHPDIVKSFIQAGRAISEDKFVAGRPDAGKRSAAEIMYPNQGKSS